MKIKKALSMILIGVIAVGLLVGCGSNENSNNSSSTKNEGQESNVEDNTKKSGKSLVVYYSATGSTKAVAETIAKSTGGDLFELEPVNPYTDADLNWTNKDSRVTIEHENEDERNVELVSTSVDNWDSYDTIFIGYPIWWGIAAWPINNFVKNNDFTGKTVIPFCTSTSSGIGDSGNLLANMAGTGDWKEGERFRSGVSDSKVQAWVEELGINK